MPRKRSTPHDGDPFAWFKNPRAKRERHGEAESMNQGATRGPTQSRGVLSALRAVLRRKHYSRQTERVYVSWVRRYIRYHDLRHPRDMGENEITQFLEHLAVNQGISASTQNQALAALVFFYRHVLKVQLDGVRKSAAAKQRRPLPVVVTPVEAQQIIRRIDGPAQLVVALLYGSGLRLKEALCLRLKDVDIEARTLFVRAGKGGKDRLALLPQTLIEAIERQIQFVCRQHRFDLAAEAGWVEMPGALDRKFRNAGRSLEWQWLFPATRCYRHGPSGQIRRHHLHETVVQRKVRAATKAAGILKRVTCHTFRHSFATTLLNMDYDLRTIQKLLGHKSVKTTQIYTHLQKDAVLRVQSPMDTLALELDGGENGSARRGQPAPVDAEELKRRMAAFGEDQEGDDEDTGVFESPEAGESSHDPYGEEDPFDD